MTPHWLLPAAAARVRERVQGAEARTDLEATLADLNELYAPLIEALLAETSLSDEHKRERGLAVLFQIAAVQLADDLADGECDYLESPARRGPCAQALLHTLSTQALLRCGLDRAGLDVLLGDLCVVGAAQQHELMTREWEAAAYERLAEQLNGHQYGAYFAILFGGDGGTADARALGLAFGSCLQVAGDARSGDSRWQALSAADRRTVSLRALEWCERAHAKAGPALRPHLEYMRGYLGVLAQ